MWKPLSLLIPVVWALLVLASTSSGTSAVLPAINDNSTAVPPSATGQGTTQTSGQGSSNGSQSTAANSATTTPSQQTPSPTTKTANNTQAPSVQASSAVTQSPATQPITTNVNGSVTQKPASNSSAAITTVKPESTTKVPATTIQSQNKSGGSNTSNSSAVTSNPSTATSVVQSSAGTTTTPNNTTPAPVTSTSSNTSGTSMQPSPAATTTQSPPATTSSKTEAPTTANTSATTAKPASTSSGTQAPTSTESGPTSSQTGAGNGTTTSSPVKTSSVTGKASTTASMLPGQQMYINEIMVDSAGVFQQLELSVSSRLNLTHYALVMVDGATNRSMSVIKLQQSQLNNSLVMVSFNKDTTPSIQEAGIGVAIYDMDKVGGVFPEDWKVSGDGLVDALVIGRTYAVSDPLVQTLTPGKEPFVLDPRLYGMTRTISRCSTDVQRNTDMFALVRPSMGSDNYDQCQERLNYRSDLSLKFTADCGQFNMATAAGHANLSLLMHFVIKEVNKKCKCGITTMHTEANPRVICCGGNSLLEMAFVAPNEPQNSALLKNYKDFVRTCPGVQLSGQIYSLDNTCYRDCCDTPKPQRGGEKQNNTKVTVAVIVTCLLIFLIIVILVILYMRRKKTAVYQFRMSRLNEEDDEDYPMGPGDQGEFVGGQEATFDIKA